MGDFVGREAELLIASECATQVRAGTPWLVLIQGEAGIGKTALVRQIAGTLTDFTVWWSTCDLAEHDEPYGVVSQWLIKAGSGLVDPAFAKRKLTSAASPVEVAAQFLDLLNSAQDRGPVALVVDDVPFIDSESLMVMGFLLRRLWADRVLFLMTARTGVDAWHGDREKSWSRLSRTAHNARLQQLSGLGQAEVSHLADLLGTGSLSAQTAKRLVRHTGGNPLYLRSVLAGFPTNPSAPLPVPQPMAATVQRKLAQFPDDSRSLIEALAVLSRESSLALVAQVAMVKDPARALEPVVGSGMVDWSPSDPVCPLRFHHDLLRQAVYAAIAPAQRKALHATAAKLVDPDTSWTHRVAATDQTDPQLAAQLGKAAQELIAQGRSARACTLLLWASDLSKSRLDLECRLLETVATMQNWLTRDGERASVLRPAVERCADSPLRTYLLARYATFSAEPSTAERLYREAIAAAGTEHDQKTHSMAKLGLGQLYTLQVREPEGTPLIEEILHDATLDEATLNEARYFYAWLVAEHAGAEAGLRAVPEVAALPPRAAVPLSHGALLLIRGYFGGLTGRLHDAIEDLTAELNRPRPAAVGLNAAYTSLPFFHYFVGAWDEAAVMAERILTKATVDNFVIGFARCHGIKAMLAAGRGHWETAEEHYRLCHAYAQQPNPAFDAVFSALAGASLAQARADGPGMLNALEPVWDLPKTGVTGMWRTWWLPLLVEAQLAAGHFKQAKYAWEQLHDLSEDTPCLRVAAAGLGGQLAQHLHDEETARKRYRQGAALPTGEDDIPLYRAQLEHAYGRYLIERREIATGLRLLEQSRERYRSLGALPFAARVTNDMAAAGIERPAATPAAELAGLTDREHTVVDLAIQGLTNREIATRLYLSSKTVEYHLGHVYTKLGVTSRRQLRAVITQG